MITYKKELQEQEVFDQFICDKCGVEYTDGDQMELQEIHSIRFTGGYTSVFGDMQIIECDLCQHCLHKLIITFCRTVCE